MGRRKAQKRSLWLCLGLACLGFAFVIIIVVAGWQITVLTFKEDQPGASEVLTKLRKAYSKFQAAHKAGTQVAKEVVSPTDADSDRITLISDESNPAATEIEDSDAAGIEDSVVSSSGSEAGKAELPEEAPVLGNPVTLQGMVLEDWRSLERKHGPAAKARLLEGIAKKTKGNVFNGVAIALPLQVPILSYPMGAGSGQGQKNIVGLQRLAKAAKAGRPCIIYGMGIADDSSFEQQMAATGCETHAFDCTVDEESKVVHKKAFTFHQWCIGPKASDSQSSGENTYVHHTVRIQTKLPCDDDCDIKVKLMSGAGSGKKADFYMNGKKVDFKTGRGMNVLSIDPVTKEVLTLAKYDLYERAQQENERLADDLNALPHGRILLMAIQDTGLENLNREALEAMRACGSKIGGGNFREGYAFVGRKGFPATAESRSRNVQMVFKTLAQTMQELNHTYLDLLKFDIEGFEWFLFESEIYSHKREQLPEQIAFELHTSSANPAYVPRDVVSGRNSVQVNKLFLKLYELGYRVTSKEVNSGDPACAEFVAVNVS